MKTFFISDVHQKLLHPKNISDYFKKEKIKLDKLYAFLDYIYNEKPDYLFLVGDIFDLWFEYKMVIPKPYFITINKLYQISQNHTKLVFLAGNHDFLFRDFFSNYMDAKILYDNYEITIDKKKIFITHGDEYTSNDIRYHILKWFLRNKFLISFFELIHPDLGLSIGKKMSRTSHNKKISAKLQEKREIGLEKFAMKKIGQGYDFVVMGHTHNPKIISYKNGFYINLGDWINNFTYLKIIDGKFNLEEWS